MIIGMTNIFITGRAGYIYSHIIKQLFKKNIAKVKSLGPKIF